MKKTTIAVAVAAALCGASAFAEGGAIEDSVAKGSFFYNMLSLEN